MKSGSRCADHFEIPYNHLIISKENGKYERSYRIISKWVVSNEECISGFYVKL